MDVITVILVVRAKMERVLSVNGRGIEEKNLPEDDLWRDALKEECSCLLV